MTISHDWPDNIQHTYVTMYQYVEFIFSDKLTKSGSVNSFCGSKGSAGESFNTMLAVFDIISPDAKSHTEYNF